MTQGTLYDIFVSFRTPDRAFKDMVVKVLQAEGYYVTDQHKFGVGEEGKDHIEIAARRIRQSSIVVVILHPTGFLTSDLEAGAQYKEVVAADEAVYEGRVKGVICLLLQNRSEDGVYRPRFAEYPNMPRNLRGAPAVIEVQDRSSEGAWRHELIRRLSQFYLSTQLLTIAEQASMHAMQRESAAEVSVPAGPADAQELPPQPLQVPPTSSVTAGKFEEDYLLSWANEWSFGGTRLQEDLRVGATGGLPRYNPRCFISLEAQSDNGQDSERRTVLQWLLTPPAKPDFVFLQGAPGSGKTTTMAALAATFACLHSPNISNLVRIGARPEVFRREAAALVPKGVPSPFPVLCPAADLASAVLGPVNPAEALVHWLAENVLHTDGDLFRKRLLDVPHVLLIDALDQVSTKASDRILNALATLQTTLSVAGGNLRIVVSVRKPFDPSRVDAKVLDVLPLSETQESEFVQRFADGIQDLSERGLFLRRMERERVALTREVSSTPLFLNAACHMVQGESALGHGRAGFCNELIGFLTEQATADLDGKVADTVAGLLQQCLERLAFAAIEQPLSTVESEHILSDLLAEQPELAEASAASGALKAEAWILTLLKSRTGLVRSENREIRFVHSLFKEFLAARYAIKTFDLNARNFASAVAKRQREAWRPVVTFVLGLSDLMKRRREGAEFLEGLLDIACESNSRELSTFYLGVALDAAEEGRRVIPRGYHERVAERARTLLVTRGSDLKLSDRANRHRQIAQLVAYRDDAQSDADAVRAHLSSFLPAWEPFRAVEVPAQSAGLGKVARIATTPVTVADFRLFLESHDRSSPAYWPPGTTPSFVNMTASGSPDLWEAQLSGVAAPVVNVSWTEAVAYCAWLTERMRLDDLGPNEFIRLLTAKEWAAFVTSIGGGRYPWGDSSPNEAAVNWSGQKLRAPSAVSLFPPLANNLYDVGSNVQVWGLADGVGWPPKPDPEGRAPVLGGSWMSGELELRVERPETTPKITHRSRGIGLRVAVAVGPT